MKRSGVKTQINKLFNKNVAVIGNMFKVFNLRIRNLTIVQLTMVAIIVYTHNLTLQEDVIIYKRLNTYSEKKTKKNV